MDSIVVACKVYPYQNLRGRIIAIYGTVKNFAEAVGMNYRTVFNKLKGYSPFTKKDMESWGKLLNIPKEQYSDFFFD